MVWEVEGISDASDLTVGDVYTYTEDDDVYTLNANGAVSTPADGKTVAFGRKTISSTTKSLSTNNGTAYFADDVKFIFLDAANGKAVVKDGVQKVNNATVYGTITESNDKLYISAVYVQAVASSSAVSTDDIVYVYGASEVADGKVILNKDNKEKKYSVYTAYIDGEEVENFYGDAGMDGFYYVNIDEDTGAYLDDETYTSTTGDMALASGSYAAYAGKYITVGSVDYEVNDDTVIVDAVDKDGYPCTTLAEMDDVKTAGKTVSVSVIYDDDNFVASYIFVTAVA